MYCKLLLVLHANYGPHRSEPGKQGLFHSCVNTA
jgi:hypothetical protein